MLILPINAATETILQPASHSSYALRPRLGNLQKSNR